MAGIEEVAYEIGQLRREGMGPATVEMYLETDEVEKIMHGMLTQMTRQNELLATQNDLLAELIVDHRPRPRRRSDAIPNILITILSVYLVAILIWQVVKAVRGG